MRAQDSPFRPYWWGTDLAAAGVDARPNVGTYGQYQFAELPPVPFELRGDLGWLATQPVHEEWSINGNATVQLPELLTACERVRLLLPPSFTRFMASSQLQDRVRSNTACFIDLDSAPVAAPAGGGHLVRFLSDQQGCLYWYLYLTEGGGDHAVVCSPDFYGVEADVPPPADPDGISFCAESFEAFLCRFWLENEVWFAVTAGTPLPDVGAEYVERYRSAG
ncbi:hypothetical protein AB0H63_01285 [Micromonospora echinospora]|uniref:hypothetical protein n=1 Tax=Micromonospora echinospora TaxID=1877 RepID=UPI0033D5B838